MKNMFKKPIFKIALILLLLVLIAFAVVRCADKQSDNGGGGDAESNENIEPQWIEVLAEDEIKDYKYDFELSLNTDDKSMDGVLNFTYYNNNEMPMNELVFYLYANSYEKKEYRAIEEDYFDYGYPNGFSAGYIDIISVDIQGGGSYEITGSQNHLLVINLDESVKPNKSTELKIEYKVTIPNSYGRFGYGDETISVVNCNPIMAVYDEETGYFDYDYNNIGDPFYSECADYTARITVPKDYLVAPTGTITDTIEKSDTTTFVVDGEDRRDFGFVASNEFEVLSEKINGVMVYSYSFTGGKINQKALDSAVDALDVFSSKFGEYPYETFNVVETNFFIGGMEYPGLVLIGDTYYTSRLEEIMEMIVVHEAAHQWWYAQVGNDQIAEPWLDEALATFSERVYYEHVYPNTYEEMIHNFVDSSFLNRNKRMDKEETRIDLHTLEYGDEYSLVVYGFGGWMMDDLRDYLGADVFYEALNKYVEDNLYQIATREDLERAIEEITGEDITPWFDENLQVQVGY